MSTSITIDTVRVRIYSGQPMTMDRAMMYACGNGGIMGESVHTYPAEYLATHIVPEGGLYPMEPTTARAVADLLERGWIERRENVIEVPACTEQYSMFRGMPAYTMMLAMYTATAKGRAEWGSNTAT